MIIRCQDGRLLESVNVVDWSVQEDTTLSEDQFRVIAKTVLDVDCEVFAGTETECEVFKDQIEQSLSENDQMMLRLYNRLLQRDDKLSRAINRIITINR